ncbi:adenylosuccinate synthetase [Candidatus Woesearchaeota archaeon]|nr:adenylosuccinate synthetase [Candidatus Woesearchaeota archaeon]
MSLDQEIYEALKDISPIPELQQYAVRSMEDILYPIIEQNSVLIVSGAFFGDEGKGKMIKAIAGHPLIEIIMRANSGENAGHTVYLNGKKYVFHLMPSGILVPEKQNLIGPECVMDPVNFFNKEVKPLVADGISYDNLVVGNVKIVTPYEKLLDLLAKPPNSSTLQGMSDSHAAKVMKSGLRMDDLFQRRDVQRGRLSGDIQRYFAFLQYKGLDSEAVLDRCLKENDALPGRIPQHIVDFAGTPDNDKIEFIIDLYARMLVNNPAFPKRGDTRRILQQALRKGAKALIECSQSFWLGNQNEKHWGSSTSADTTANGVIASAGYNPRKYSTAVFNVHKLPPSRVGRGANPVGLVSQTYFSDKGIDTLDKMKGKCEDVGSIEKLFFDSIQTNGIFKPAMYKDTDGKEYPVNEALAIAWSRKFGECGATTKKPRVLGFFDCVAQYEVNQAQGPYLSISAVDRLDECDKVAMVVAYAYHHKEGKELESNGKTYRNGDVIKPGDQLPCDHVLEHCHPIFKVMDGWKRSPIGKGKRGDDDPLPVELQYFIMEIEDRTGSEVIAIGNGPESDDLIYIQKVLLSRD